MQGIALAWNAQSEWRNTAQGEELRVHLPFNRTIRAAPGGGLTNAAPIAAELWSYLPQEGRVALRAHQPINRLALRLPDGSDLAGVKVRLSPPLRSSDSRSFGSISKGDVVGLYNAAGQEIAVLFPLKGYETVERAAGVDYRVQWKGSSVLGISPTGKRVPLYSDRAALRNSKPQVSSPRYPR